MTVPLDTRNDIRSMDADGVPRAEIARRLRVSRNTVAKYADMEDMSPAAPVPARRERPRSASTRGGSSRSWRPTSARRASSATPPGGSTTGWSRRGATPAPTRPSSASCASGGSRARPARARATWSSSGPGHLPGGLRQLPRRRRGRGAGPQAAGGDPSPLQRQAVLRAEVSEVGVPVRGARGDLLALGPRPEGAGPGQRDRGGQDGPRRGDGVRAVLPVQGALPRRVEVLQPLLGQREGVGGERGSAT